MLEETGGIASQKLKSRISALITESLGLIGVSAAEEVVDRVSEERILPRLTVASHFFSIPSLLIRNMVFTCLLVLCDAMRKRC